MRSYDATFFSEPEDNLLVDVICKERKSIYPICVVLTDEKTGYKMYLHMGEQQLINFKNQLLWATEAMFKIKQREEK